MAGQALAGHGPPRRWTGVRGRGGSLGMRGATGQQPAAPDAPAAAVHGAAHAAAALAASGARGVVLLSAPGAGGFLGAPVFLRMVAQAAAAHPAVPHRAVLDCGDAPGFALAALRAGARTVVLDPACPAWPAVTAAAAAVGATVLPARPEALDMARLDLRRAAGRSLLAAWLSAGR